MSSKHVHLCEDFPVKHSKMMTRAIIEARIYKKITQKDMAKRLNISRQKYNKMESGKMSIEDLKRICDILELRIMILPCKHAVFI